MIIYNSAAIYVDDATTLQARITRLGNIITALEMNALNATNVAHISEYDLDSGQSKVKMVYRSASEVAAAILQFETLRQTWINRLNGRKITLVDSSNFMRRC